MSTDAELLRRYIQERSETAFTELVQRHLNLVYFAALRQVGGDAHRAKDVAQTVFTDLARKAASLADRVTLTGWLHTSTRFAATKARRADRSRKHYEQEAITMNALLHESDPATEWERLRPMIDDVIHELSESDRDAVLLRFFEDRSFTEIGTALRLSEDAARMRVDRALDKLRDALAQRGVKSTNAALAVIFANQVGATAPAGLAGAIASTALAGAGMVAAFGFSMSTMTTAILSAVAITAVGSTFFQRNHARRAEAELAALTVERESLQSKLRVEQERVAHAVRENVALQNELTASKAAATGQRAAPPAVPAATPAPVDLGTYPREYARRTQITAGILGNLRRIAAALNQFQLENGRPPASIHELVGETKLIKRLDPVDGEDYSALLLGPGQTLAVTASDGTTITYDRSPAPPLPRVPTSAEQRVNELANRINPAVNKAMAAYRAANGGSFPSNPQALIPFFASTQEGADFVELLEAQSRLPSPVGGGSR